MVIFDSTSSYLESFPTLQAKVAAIDAAILALYTTLAKAALTDNIQEYSLNDGQVIIKAIYNGTKSIEASIYALERLRIMYTNRMTGRITRLVDSKNFIGNGGSFR